jgi:membrane-bound serine protease (ClpP class)
MTEIFYVLLTIGLILIGMEIFVPGGLLGVLGAAALIGAIVMGFRAFPGYGVPIAFGILLLVGVAMGLWIKFFPRTGLGKRMTVSRDLSTFKATETGISSLAGREGVAVSQLRPAGFANIDGRRVDVVTRGEMIEAGSRIMVMEVSGNRVVVARHGTGAA